MNKYNYIGIKINSLEDELDTMIRTEVRGIAKQQEIHKKQVELNILKEIKSALIAWGVINVRFEYEDGDSSLGIKKGFYQTSELSSADNKYLKKALELEESKIEYEITPLDL